jgi:hypothetical protein
MGVDGGETASFIVKTYTFLDHGISGIIALFRPEEFTEAVKKLSFVLL